jgi:hypothetical protein
MGKITREYFDKYVKTNNPYNKPIFYAFITWAGTDFSEKGKSTESAIENLWQKVK